MAVLKVRLVSGRSIGQGRGKERGKLSQEYFENVAICELNSEDMNLLSIPEGENVRIKTEFGDVVVRALKSKQVLPQGLAFMPYGPWASRVMDPETHGSGMPSLKGIEATVCPALGEDVQKLTSLVEVFLGRK